MDEIIKAIHNAQTILTCKICLRSLKNPVVLKKCGHSFCHECISKNKSLLGINLCSFCSNHDPENEMLPAEYERDKLKSSCFIVYKELAEDFGDEAAQQIYEVISSGCPKGVLTEQPALLNTTRRHEIDASKDDYIYYDFEEVKEEAPDVKLKNFCNSDLGMDTADIKIKKSSV